MFFRPPWLFALLVIHDIRVDPGWTWNDLKRRHRTRWGAPLPRPDVSKWGGVLDSRIHGLQVKGGFWYLLQGQRTSWGTGKNSLPPMENEKFMGRCVFKWASRLVLPSFHYDVEGIRFFLCWKTMKKIQGASDIIVSSRWSETRKQTPLVSRVGVTNRYIIYQDGKYMAYLFPKWLLR